MSKMNYSKSNKFRNGIFDIRKEEMSYRISKFDKEWIKKHNAKQLKTTKADDDPPPWD